MSATAPCKGTAEKESPPCIQCRYDTKNPGVETEASCARHTATWRRHKRLLAGTATADDMTLTRNLVALDDARIRANRVECARIRAKIRKVESAQRQVDALPVEMLTPKVVAAVGDLALIWPGVFREEVKAHI